MAQLIKLSSDHYIIVDDSEIKMDDYYLDDTNTVRRAITEAESYWTHRKHYKKVTHSTIPPRDNITLWYFSPDLKMKPEILSLSEVKELNEDKKYTETDLKNAFIYAMNHGCIEPEEEAFNRYVELYIKPKTQWEVEFIDGKLKLK